MRVVLKWIGVLLVGLVRLGEEPHRRDLDHSHDVLPRDVVFIGARLDLMLHQAANAVAAGVEHAPAHERERTQRRGDGALLWLTLLLEESELDVEDLSRRLQPPAEVDGPSARLVEPILEDVPPPLPL